MKHAIRLVAAMLLCSGLVSAQQSPALPSTPLVYGFLSATFAGWTGPDCAPTDESHDLNHLRLVDLDGDGLVDLLGCCGICTSRGHSDLRPASS